MTDEEIKGKVKELVGLLSAAALIGPAIALSDEDFERQMERDEHDTMEILLPFVSSLVRTTYREAIEEAAKVAESMAIEYAHAYEHATESEFEDVAYHGMNTAKEIAATIRHLVSSPHGEIEGEGTC